MVIYNNNLIKIDRLNNRNVKKKKLIHFYFLVFVMLFIEFDCIGNNFSNNYNFLLVLKKFFPYIF